MSSQISLRVISEAKFIIVNKSTVRQTAIVFGVSKSTVHYDLTKRLKELDVESYDKVRKILCINLSERHIRGGMATRDKFKKREDDSTGKSKPVKC